KGRPRSHPMIVHLAEPSVLKEWAAHVPDEAWALADAFWPGPLTLILNRAAAVPDAVTGGLETVGLRVPAQPLALALLQGFRRAGAGDASLPLRPRGQGGGGGGGRRGREGPDAPRSGGAGRPPRSLSRSRPARRARCPASGGWPPGLRQVPLSAAAGSRPAGC